MGRQPIYLFLISCLTVLALLHGFLTLEARESTEKHAKVPVYQNTVPGVAYIGSRACGRCHVSVFEEYTRTLMGRSMCAPGQSPTLRALSAPVTVLDKSSDMYFQVFRKNNEFYQKEFALRTDGKELFSHTEKLAYAVGAGKSGVSYLVQRGNYLFEAPLSYYVGSKSWQLSPGYTGTGLGFSRPILSACSFCHSGRPQPVPNGNGLYKNPPFQQLAIGCENCHGPGELHRKERMRFPLPRGIDTSIVNPANLSPWLVDNICMGCHQLQDARVLQPRKDFGDYRPGTPLIRTYAIFKVPLAHQNDDGSTELDSYFSSMILSKCYRASGGKLSCITCHDPHWQPSVSGAPAYFRHRCLTCHSEKSCGLALNMRLQQNRNNCITCHMPRRNIRGFSHAMTTSHRIVAYAEETYPSSGYQDAAPEVGGLVLLDGKPDESDSTLSPLVLLKAYHALIAEYPDRPFLEKRYTVLLNHLADSEPNNSLVLSYLAQIELEKKTAASAANALHYFRRAVAAGSTSPRDYILYAELLTREGQVKQAIEVLNKSIGLAPFNPLSYQDLAIAYLLNGSYDKCVETARRGLGLFPGDQVQRNVLKRCKAR